MNDLHTALYDTRAVRAIEARAMTLPGHDAWALMQRAAAAAWSRLRVRWPSARRVLVVCGSGNNGGDGYALATLARAAGLDAVVVQVGAVPTRHPADRAVAQWSGPTQPFAGALPEADIVVDALFGIGLDRAPDGIHADAIAAMGRHRAPVLSLDVPSGLNADTGDVPGDAVRAALTVSFIVWKRGLWTGRAAACCGVRVLATLDVPATARDAMPDANLIAESDVAEALPPRARDAHKGRAGHVVVIGGDYGYSGAAVIAASASARAGAGLVSLASRAETVAAMLSRQPEVMARAVDGPETWHDLIARADALALGPGLGHSEWSLALARAACAARRPLVVDADALNLLAAGRIDLPPDAVLTPHPGEAARLLDCDVATVSRDRFAAARTLAQRFQSVVVLKGAGSVIAAPQGEVSVCPFGNPGMASGGMGDALTGVIAALRAQGFAGVDAARIGVAVHALAADRAARSGERGLLASDVVGELRAVMNP